MKFARIKDLREDKELKQEEVAKILGITQQQYSLYETGKREIPMSLCIELAKIYNVSLDYIAGLTIDKRGIGYKKEENIKVEYKINQKNKKGKNIIKIEDKKNE